MEEVWKDVVGYEGYYMVSNLGRIKSMRFRHIKRERIRKTFIRKDGYECVGLSKNAICKTYSVHRIVATAFLDNPNNFEMVNHKDENTTNNAVSNLEWCSRSYNQIYSMNLHPERKNVFCDNFKKGIKSSSFIVKGEAHKHFEPIIQSTKDGCFVKRYENAAVAGNELGKPSGNIYMAAVRNKNSPKIRKRHIKCTAYGYVWEFE